MQKIISIAPMINVTNNHFRTLLRLITKRAVLYTEMVSQGAVIHSHKKLLPFSSNQHPIVLQIGGSDPQALAQAGSLGEYYGYDSINLNVGCPSNRVQSGYFGAVLMKQPLLVKKCVQQMAKKVKIPITVKCRIGVDHFNSYQFLRNFVQLITQSGHINHLIIHARMGYLKGLSPKQNRTVPPLMYDRVFKLKQEFPHINLQINGGIKYIEQGLRLVTQNELHGCMIGRLAMQDPFSLAKIDSLWYKQPISMNNQAEKRKYIMLKYAQYIKKLHDGQIMDNLGNRILNTSKFELIKPIINFYHGQKCAAIFRRTFSDLTKLSNQPLHEIIAQMAQAMYKKSLDSPQHQESIKQQNQH